jgi:hypothetical protein
MAGVTNNGVLDTDATGGGGSTFVAIGQPVNVTDAAVLNTTPVGTEYGLAVRAIGGTGGGPATIADGANVVEGSLADTAIITDTTGTINGKLRGLVKWAFERMPASLGQKLMSTSFPVVISSDQSTLPISGTVATGGLTDAQLRAVAVPVSAASLPLPTGASTEATLATRLAEATFTTRINTLGQNTAANSTPVVLASDQSSIPVASPAYAVKLDEASAVITYVGLANPGSIGSAAVWNMRRLDATTGLVVEYADGNSNFDNIWDNRAVLPYS